MSSLFLTDNDQLSYNVVDVYACMCVCVCVCPNADTGRRCLVVPNTNW